MTIPSNFTTTNPSLKDLLDRFRQDLLLNFNCHAIGTIQEFNKDEQTASVSINYQKTKFVLNTATKQYEQQQVSYPILMQAPVVVLGGGQTYLTFPIEKGDECLIFFNDRDIDNWFQGISTAPVATPRLHSFADALILVGVRSLPNVLTQYSATHAVLANSKGQTVVAVGPTTIKIANGDFTLNGLMQELVTDLQNLITALTSNAATFIPITNINPPSPTNPSALSPVVVSALNAVSTSLSTLATELGELLE